MDVSSGLIFLTHTQKSIIVKELIHGINNSMDTCEKQITLELEDEIEKLSQKTVEKNKVREHTKEKPSNMEGKERYLTAGLNEIKDIQDK